MAEGAVGFLIRQLGSLLVQEASLLGELSNDISQIKYELESMKSLLKDADRKKYSNERVETWVGQLRDVAFEMEDVLDEFIYSVNRPNRAGRLMAFLCCPINCSQCLIARHKIASQLQIIKSKVHEISERRQRYGIDVTTEDGTSSTGATQRYEQIYNPIYEEEENMVGTERKKEVLVRWIMDMEQPILTVISVVGIGGLGKSTLVRKIYDLNLLKSHFDSYAWVSVSESYQTVELLRSIVKEFFKENKEMVPNNLGTLDYGQLVEMLNKHLQGKRYIIALDDVWSINVWRDLHFAFPESRCGSRIMVTSRNENCVPPLGVGSRVYHLQPLNEEEAWTLFCNKAFSDSRYQVCPQEIESWARSIVKKCEGLPLAIAAIGGLMSLKEKTEVEWKKAYESLNWELSNNPMLDNVKNILWLSFCDLPKNLKNCFLYCSAFPEDYKIGRKRLIRLWVAEGFIEEKRGMTLEEVGDDYLKQLIFRSMLQVADTNARGRVKECRLHDLVRELAVSISEKDRFFFINDDRSQMTLESNARRLSIHKLSENHHEWRKCMPHLRSFFMFPLLQFKSSSLPEILSRFRLLRVLDLEGVSITSVPNELANLFNLHYISLRKTEIRELPNIERLGNLQTLDIRETNLEKLPGGIEKLQKLRHLMIYDYNPRIFDYVSGKKVPKGIWQLPNLQTLQVMEADREIIRHVGKMSQLRSFGISKVGEAEGMELCSSIQKLSYLQHLLVSAKNENEPLGLATLSPPPLLGRLTLAGELRQVPNWFNSLRNVTYLALRCSRLREDLLPSLRALPSLGCLALDNAYDGQQLWFHAEGFPKLTKLYLRNLRQLEVVRIEEGALPNIKELYLSGCEKLKMPPQGIEYLTGLQKLVVLGVPKELVQGIQDNPKLRRIPNIRVSAIAI